MEDTNEFVVTIKVINKVILLTNNSEVDCQAKISFRHLSDVDFTNMVIRLFKEYHQKNETVVTDDDIEDTKGTILYYANWVIALLDTDRYSGDNKVIIRFCDNDFNYYNNLSLQSPT